MAPNLEVHEHSNNCAIPYIENVVNVKNNVSSNADSGETISLASKRQERLRSNSDEEASPVLETIAGETYNLYGYSKNAMLIIHSNCYDSSDKTADKVKTTFEKFRFEVDILDNRNGEEIISELDKFFGRDFTEYGCAAVVVVCPMADVGAYKTKGKFFTDDDVLKYFQNGVVPTLEGKPTIFISEMDKLFMKKNVNRFEGLTSDKLNIMRFQKTTETLRGRRVIPPNFLRNFCEKLEQFADTEDFQTIVGITIHTQKLSYYDDDDPSSTIKPCYAIGTYLTKELQLWKTAKLK